MDRWVEEQKDGQMSDREAAASGHCGQGYKQGQGPYRSSWRVTLGAGGMRACTDLFQVQGFPAESPTDLPQGFLLLKRLPS